MATYKEIFDIQSDDSLRNRISVACLVTAHAISIESDATVNHANRVIWAKEVLNDPTNMATKMLRIALAANKDVTSAQIRAVSDSALQTLVNSSVNVLAS